MKSDRQKYKKKFLLIGEQEMDDEFLKNLVKYPCPIPKEENVEIISTFIEKSKLYEKLKKDYILTKKNPNDNILKVFAEKLNFDVFDPGKTIFKIVDSGENFYLI